MSMIETIRQNIPAGMAATVVEIEARFTTDRVTVWRDRPGEFYGVTTGPEDIDLEAAVRRGQVIGHISLASLGIT